MPVKRKLEPVGLFREFIRNKQAISLATGDFSFKRQPNGEIVLSPSAADEISMEAWAYLEFFKCANALATLTDLKTSGQYITQESMQLARDMYVTARDQCRRLQIAIHREDIKREYKQ